MGIGDVTLPLCGAVCEAMKTLFLTEPKVILEIF